MTAAIANSTVDTVRLAGDISISTSLTVKRTVTLDLNGHVLKYESANKGSVIVVENGGQLTIEDSNTSNLSHKFNSNGKLWVLDEASGTETVTGGVITGGTGTDISTFGGTTWYCGGALIKNGGSLTMRGGNIIGCSAECGGGVCIDSEQGQFSMSGGSIAGCVASDIGGVGGRSRVRRETLDARVAKSVELVNRHPDDQWIIWCGLNDEADRLEKLIPGAVNVKGSMSAEDKARAFLDFADGNIRVLVTKAQMAAFGLNWQNCHRMIFCGINDSWESYYQSIRRCYRFGQRHVVDVHIVCSDLESEIAANIQRKEHEATMLSADLVATMNETRNYRKAA